mgnify:CR=1 FL=1
MRYDTGGFAKFLSAMVGSMERQAKAAAVRGSSNSYEAFRYRRSRRGVTPRVEVGDAPAQARPLYGG